MAEEEPKEGGSLFGLIKKIVIVVIIALILMYFFKRNWFDMILGFF